MDWHLAISLLQLAILPFQIVGVVLSVRLRNRLIRMYKVDKQSIMELGAMEERLRWLKLLRDGAKLDLLIPAEMVPPTGETRH